MLKHTKPAIVVGGENLIDSMQTTDSKGAVHETHKLGGSPYNVAFALGRQGQNTHYVTPVSNDDFGQQLAVNLQAEGVELAGGRRDEPTTRAIVTLKDGIPHYEFRRDGTAERCVTAQSLCEALPDNAAHFHAGSFAFANGKDAEAWEAAFNEAGDRGMTTSFDPNVRSSLVEDATAYRARIMRLLKRASIVKLSDEDLEWIYPDLPQGDAIKAILGLTDAKVVALTKGPDGAEGWTPSLHCAVPNPDLETLVDTIGAGDTFMATLIAGLADMGLLSDLALADITDVQLRALLSRGVQAACLNCGKEGCNPPRANEIDAALSH